MAEKRTQTQGGPLHAPRARPLLLEKYRARIANAGRMTGPWPGIVRDLEAGLPFTCQRWQLPAPVRETLPAGSEYGWWQLDGDTLSPVDSPVERYEESDR